VLTALTVVRAAALAALAGWVWLALFRGGFYRPGLRVPAAPDPPRWPSVAVVVPARDEAAVLPLTLPTLHDQDYPGPLRVIVVDDNSSDGTADLVAARWPGATLVRPGQPPPGWAGKPWALAAGVAEAGDTDYLLLSDADIAHRPASVRTLVAAAEGHGYALVSQMARLRTRTGWEKLVVPAFVFFFALLYPFRWSNRPGARTAAAAGGCLLVRRDALARAGGVAPIRGAVIDDVALGRLVKRSGAATFLGFSGTVESLRAYPALPALWRMVSRSAYTQLGHSPVALAGTVLGLALMFFAPVVALAWGAFAGDRVTAAAGTAGWLLMAGLYAPMLRYYRLPVAAALALPFTATLYLAMTMDSAIAHHRGRATWKGRHLAG
jgi:hopene-associated glycosyltransferase HpnB